MPASNSNVQEWNERAEAELAALRAENTELRKHLETMLNIFADPRAAGTNVDGRWMGVPDWETVEKIAEAING